MVGRLPASRISARRSTPSGVSSPVPGPFGFLSGARSSNQSMTEVPHCLRGEPGGNHAAAARSHTAAQAKCREGVEQLGRRLPDPGRRGGEDDSERLGSSLGELAQFGPSHGSRSVHPQQAPKGRCWDNHSAAEPDRRDLASSGTVVCRTPAQTQEVTGLRPQTKSRLVLGERNSSLPPSDGLGSEWLPCPWVEVSVSRHPADYGANGGPAVQAGEVNSQHYS